MNAKCDIRSGSKLNPLVGGVLQSCSKLYHSWAEWFSDGDSIMRQYIRHPSDIPIAYCLGRAQLVLDTKVDNSFFASDRLRDVSRGGLCFNADCLVRKGTPIHIEIAIKSPPYRADGTVAWCKPEGNHFAVGVEFNEPSTRYSIRMVEQVCHIEAYRVRVQETEGRELSSEEAANEWIEKYAADFPI